jgi:ribosomal protein S18 acetylase RimI-like enzyme
MVKSKNNNPFNAMQIEVLESDIATAATISKLIPEFSQPHPVEEYRKRMQGKKTLILVAHAEGKVAGFKAGYDKYGDGSFYSWMGGVLPEYRKQHIAKRLAERQESWARVHGFNCIIFKTRNRHKAMLIFAITNGFHIIGIEPKDNIPEDYRILLRKDID